MKDFKKPQDERELGRHQGRGIDLGGESGDMCTVVVASGWETLLDAESWEEGTALERHSWAGVSRENNARFH